MNILYVAWQDPNDRHWRPVGRLSFEDERFRFVYTYGAKTAKNFLPFGRMTNLHSVYESSELFPLFSNRLLNKNRPEYEEYLEWLNIPAGKDDPLALLGRSGGIRGTDSLVIFPCPEPTSEGKYTLSFFSQGLRYLTREALEVIGNLKSENQLYLLLDVQNTIDPSAVAIRTEKPLCIIGYIPRYFAEDFHFLLQGECNNSVRVYVDQVNQNAPIQFRLLCRINADWPETFKPCSGEMYQPLASPSDQIKLREKPEAIKQYT